jgi:hypothetical protein
LRIGLMPLYPVSGWFWGYPNSPLSLIANSTVNGNMLSSGAGAVNAREQLWIQQSIQQG